MFTTIEYSLIRKIIDSETSKVSIFLKTRLACMEAHGGIIVSYHNIVN